MHLLAVVQEATQEVVQSAAVKQPTSHNHVVIGLWFFVALSIVEAVVIWIVTKARGGWTYIATIPFVNLRQLASLILAAVTIVGTGVVGYLSGVWPPEYVFQGALFAVSVWMSIDVAQYGIKRWTTDANITSTQNVMAAQATSGERVDALTARAIANPNARQPVPAQETPVGDPAATAAANSPRPKLSADDSGVV